jgi:hypothetical protein
MGGSVGFGVFEAASFPMYGWHGFILVYGKAQAQLNYSCMIFNLYVK